MSGRTDRRAESLPPVPDEALDAALAGSGVTSGDLVGEARAMLAPILAAAWPHLYAAALWHAAERCDEPDDQTWDWIHESRGPSDRCGHIGVLHRMADEATR